MPNFDLSGKVIQLGARDYETDFSRGVSIPAD